MQIFFSFYQLKRKQQSNSKTYSSRQNGALVKVVDDDGHFGVADLCPWPELGDLTLQQEIANKGTLFQRAIELAQMDLAARCSNQKLVSTDPVNNHLLITDYQNFRFEKPLGLYKVKGNKNFKALSDWLQQNKNYFSAIRLDFNSCLTFEEFSVFVNQLDNDVLKKIEVVEDPFTFNLEQWISLQKKINLAVDFEKGEWTNKIVKPTRQNLLAEPMYLTSSMDHPVGIAHGMHFAQKLPNKVHGFLTLNIYEKSKYSEAFVQDNQKLTLNSDGCGIGFSALLAKENWIPQIEWENSFKTALLFNSQGEDHDIKNLFLIKKDFLKTHAQNHILIPSSGSTQRPGDLKVLAFHKTAILQSARRVVQEFKLTSEMNWGSVLPLFHVGGLGILARAYCVGAKVYYSTWTEFSVDFLVENRIQLLSLVPIQIYDLVKQNIRAPQMLKYVFVGGGFLDEKIERQAIELGWPLVITYGMTETASMISAKNQAGDFELFKGVEIFKKNESFFVKTDSAAMAQLNFTQGHITTTEFSAEVLEIPDQLQMNADQTFKLLGRTDDQIKINGELVNLNRLKALLPLELRQRLEIVALADDRKGFKLVLVGEQLSFQQLRQIVTLFNQSVNKFEKIELVDTLNQFPRSALDKIKLTELKNLIEEKNTYEKL